MPLRCSDPSCDSRKNGQPMFSVVLLFDEDRDPAEDARKIPPEYFTCCTCGAQAEEVTLNDKDSCIRH